MTDKIINDKLLIGRDEWCGLPELNLPAIKAKVDTGAKTSSLHAYNIVKKRHNQQDYVYFDIHPIQANNEIIVKAKAKLVEQRHIMSSNGHKELRYIISTILKMADQSWEIELTLSNRDPLRYRMLLGREAINSRVLIDPNISCHQSKIKQASLYNWYSA